MAMGKTLRKEVTEWGILTIVIVVLSVILLKARAVDTVACRAGALNTSVGDGVAICCTNTSNACSINESVRALYTNINTFVTAFSEPKNWVIIVIVALIGFGLIALFAKKKN